MAPRTANTCGTKGCKPCRDPWQLCWLLVSSLVESAVCLQSSLSHSHSSWLLSIGLAFLFFFIHSYLYISQLQESGWGRTKVGPFSGAPKAGETGCLPFFSFSSEENSSYLESSLLVLNKISLGDGTMQAKSICLLCLFLHFFSGFWCYCVAKIS